MADFKVGHFSKRTSTGTQSVTEVGFQPAAVIFWCSGGVTDGTYVTSVIAGLGFSTGDGEGTGSIGINGGSASASTRRRSAERAISLVDGSGTVHGEASVQSFDADGFTLNWTTANATAYLIHYLAIGGAGVDAAVRRVSLNGTTNVAVSSLGFSPDALITVMPVMGTTPPATLNDAGLAVGTSSTAGQWQVSVWDEHAQANMVADRSSDTGILANAIPLGSSIFQISRVSLDADGFTIVANASTTDYIYVLALGGVDAAVGSFTKDTGAAPDSQPVTGVGFEPKAVLLATNHATVTGTTTHARLGIGATDGSGEEATAFSSEDASATSDVDAVEHTGRVLVINDADDTTEDAEASLTSLDSDGFTLSWAVNNAAATRIYYLALGGDAAGGTATAAASLPSITASGSGAQSHVATGAATLASLTASATGTQTTTGSGAAALGSLTASASGVMQPSATGAATLPSLTGAGQGTHTVTGSSATSLPSLTTSGTGTQTITGATEAGGTTELNLAVSASSDDAFENAGTVTFGGWPTNPAADATNKWIGLRFQNVAIPAGVTVVSATLEVVPSASGDEPDVTIFGIAEDDTETFAASSNNISGRPRTSASVAWSNADLGADDATYFAAPDLASVVQEIVDRAGWVSGNALGFVIRGGSDSNRDLAVYTYDSFLVLGGDPLYPKLTVTYDQPALSLPSLTVSGSGLQSGEPTASAAAELPSLTASGSGAQTHSGSGAAALASLTAAASGVMVPSGAGAAALPSLTADAEGAQSVEATGAAALPALAASASGEHVFTSTGVATLPSLTTSGAGALAIGATAAASLPALAAAATGVQSHEATGAASLPALTADGDGTSVFTATATAAFTLPALTASGVGNSPAAATAAVALPFLALAGVGHWTSPKRFRFSGGAVASPASISGGYSARADTSPGGYSVRATEIRGGHAEGGPATGGGHVRGGTSLPGGAVD